MCNSAKAGFRCIKYSQERTQIKTWSLTAIPADWSSMLTTDKLRTREGEFIENYATKDVDRPTGLFSTDEEFCPPLKEGSTSFCLPAGRPSQWIGPHFYLLIERPPTQEPVVWQGWMRCTRFVTLTKGKDQTLEVFHLFVGP